LVRACSNEHGDPDFFNRPLPVNLASMEPRSFEHGDGKKAVAFFHSPMALAQPSAARSASVSNVASHFLQSLDAGTGRAHFPEQIFMAGANDGR
jgi:hypothetical protein